MLIGVPQDEGCRRNFGRPGSSAAPPLIRKHLYRLVPREVSRLNVLDLGDLIVTDDLETSQLLLGDVVGELLRRGCVPIVLGGGHEIAFGTYLGFVAAQKDVAVINLDAHLDVRPLLDGRGHGGSPFRQMMEHETRPLPGSRYACLGAQPSATSEQHEAYLRDRGGEIAWADDVRGRLIDTFTRTVGRLVTGGTSLYITLDADVVRSSDVPGVSAPAALGLSGEEVTSWAAVAGATLSVACFELVEVAPRFDVEERSARWAAVAIWEFLCGLARRGN